MITELRLRSFKNFQDATLRLGLFTIVVGANGSGKGNIRDAFRFIHGIGRGYSIAEIIGGKFGGGGQREWEPLRGGAHEIARIGDSGFGFGVKLSITRDDSKDDDVRYEIDVNRPGVGSPAAPIIFEELIGDGEVIIRPPGPSGISDGRGPNPSITLSTVPSLTSFAAIKDGTGHDNLVGRPLAQSVATTFSKIRFFDFHPNQLRLPSFPGQTMLGDHGANLPTVLRDICQDQQRKNLLVDWIQELTPLDVVDLEFPEDAVSGLTQLVLKERSGLSIPAYSASDGTLRFLAMLAVFLGRHDANLYFFEELETGVHPTRLKLLVSLIEHQTAKYGFQVVATTHSPVLLSLISEQTFASTSVVYRDPDTTAATIRPVSELPDAARLRHEQGLGALFAEGWMEDALSFNAGSEQVAAK